jgi:hypothetical protein
MPELPQGGAEPPGATAGPGPRDQALNRSIDTQRQFVTAGFFRFSRKSYFSLIGS